MQSDERYSRQIRFAPIVEALARSNYRGGLHVELSRHSHEAPTAARKAFDFLKPLVDKAIATEDE